MNANNSASEPTTTAPEFNFNALTAEDTPTLPVGDRAHAVDSTPFPAWIKETYDKGTAKRVTVPLDQHKTLLALIRRASVRSGLGARTRTNANEDGTVTVTFKGVEKREFKGVKTRKPTAGKK